jgi:hypothetical protein
MRRLVFLSAVLTVLSGSVAQMALAGDSGLEQALVEGASTPQQHAALAKYYEGKAAAAKKEADDHRAMAKSYSGVKMTQAAAMKEHCDKLATLADEEAKEYETLASAHRGMAK